MAVPAVLKRAQWIWPDSFQWDLVDCHAAFRKPFKLDRVPTRAPFFITADQSYRLFVNGKFVCRGPARGFQSHWPFDEADIAPFLKAGRNLIAIHAYNPGRSTYQYISHGIAGLLAAGEWGKTDVRTDGSWKCTRLKGYKRGTVPSSFQLFNQEHYDARADEPDWESPGFDDSSWGRGADARAWNSPPFHALEERGIPLLVTRRIRAAKLVGMGEGRCGEGYRDTRDVVEVRSRERLDHSAARGRADLLSCPATGRGRFRSFLLDFSKLVVGSLSLDIRGGRGGEIVDSLHVEEIDHGKLAPRVSYGGGCKAAMGSRLVLRPGWTRHTLHHPYGFRYLVITVRDSVSPLKVGVSVDWTGYPLERKGSFSSSDRLLERIWETCAWTQQCCSLDSYVDTPWREQAQWWGDARVQGWNTFHLSGDARLLRRGIHCIGSQTTPNGLTYGHSPTMAHNCVLPDFTLIWILTMWDHYWQTGKLEAYRTHAEGVDRALGYFASAVDPRTGLVGYDKRYWLFLDWADIFKDGYPALLNLWLLETLDKAGRMARLAGEAGRAAAGSKAAGPPASLAAEYARRAGRLRRSLNVLVRPDGLVADGLKWDGSRVDETFPHTQTLALMTGLEGISKRAITERVLLPMLRGSDRPKASAYWITYCFSALIERGYGRDVVECIRRRWERMAEHGTTFEGWEPAPGDTSMSHAWAAHPLFHLMRVIGGIRQDSPAWRRVLVRPEFIGESGGARVPAPGGPVECRWRRSGRKVRVTVSAPAGTTARVELPGMRPAIVRGAKGGRRGAAFVCLP